MPIVRMEDWNKWVEANKDPYGKCCVDVARRVMELIDEGEEMNPHKLITKADNDIHAGGITGFMAGAVASMVSQCCSRGEEFRKAWNKETQIRDEGDKANEEGGVLNPALLTIQV